MRFTLCKLFLGVTMAALASAGMTLRTRLWAESIFSFSIALYAAVAILAFRRDCDSRAFRGTFAVVGVVYVLLALCNLFSPIRELLITNRALVVAGRQLTFPPQSANGTPPLNGQSTNNTWKAGSGTLNLTTSSYNPTGSPSTVTVYNLAEVDEWENLFGSPLLTPATPVGAFLIIGHCVWSWLLALAAACFAAFVTRPSASSTAN